MQSYANPCASRHWPQIARRKCCKYHFFFFFPFSTLTFKSVFCFPDLLKEKMGLEKKKKKKSIKFLINMQMQANRFKCWIELISATSFVCAVITNYRQASDGRIRPRMLSHRPSSWRGIAQSNQTVRKSGKMLLLFQDLFRSWLIFKPMLSPFHLFNPIHYSKTMKVVQPEIYFLFPLSTVHEAVERGKIILCSKLPSK